MARFARTIRVSAIVVTAAMFASAPAMAQGQPGRGDRQPGGDRGGQRQPGGGDRQPGGGGPGMMRGFGGMGGMGGGQMFEAPITTRDMEKYAEILELTEDQREAVAALLEANQQEFSEKAAEARTKLEALREEAREARDPSIWRDMGAQMETFRKARTAMETGFFNDMKAVLTPAQAEKFPRIERQRRREQTIGFGLMSGERADLIRIIGELELPADQSAPLDPVLQQYEVDLDRELQNRNKLFEESQSRVREMFEQGATDEMQRALEQGREASTRVREVNRRYARQIESLLPDESRERFAERVRRESFPMIYRPSFATRVVEAAAAIEDLDDSQKSAIASIRDAYVRESTTLNRQLEQATVKQEETLTVQDLMSRGFRGMGSEETEALRDKRRELDNSTMDKVRAILTPEQAEKLPRRDERGGGPGDRGERGEQRRPQQRRGRPDGGDDAPAPRPDSRT